MGCYHSSPLPFNVSLRGFRQHASSSASSVHLLPSSGRSHPEKKPRISFKRISVKDAPMLQVKYPCRSSTWIRGSPVAVEWLVLDPSVAHVKIELCQLGSNATTLLAAAAPNTGCFVYTKVPWGLIGDGFFVRIDEILPHDATVVARRTLSEVFRVGNSRWPESSSGSEGSITPVHARTVSSSASSLSKWQESTFQSVTPALGSVC
ncbi:Aste57867_24172 [Aphanomyces stellatus]|uniref:Aste57867_24172 protein n=1 Tax=Aphanomyces stellatus TaxID=120398 RepID=A0A485LPS1_9STRA|nr:hypothetical protein As57867_024098 [Aphanomyces stellatus]VFU00814.1 Aste57867_24172 [Aphanomyces stellatus]